MCCFKMMTLRRCWQIEILACPSVGEQLSGHEREAVQAYWQLWRDYPDSPYTLMARRKLSTDGVSD